jgi:acetyl-CoA carboxylase biotin carboxyl carrier protein
VKYLVTVAGQSFEIEVDHERLVRINGHPLYLDLEQVGGLPVYSLALDDTGYVVFVEGTQGDYQVEVQGQAYSVSVKRQLPRLAAPRVECLSDAGDCLAVTTPLAGNLISLLAAVGDQVEAGQAVAVVESMKMQIQLKASQSGMVEVVHGPAGRNVDEGEELLRLRVGRRASQAP